MAQTYVSYPLGGALTKAIDETERLLIDLRTTQINNRTDRPDLFERDASFLLARSTMLLPLLERAVVLLTQAHSAS